MTRSEFLTNIWTSIINAPLDNTWIDSKIRSAKARADAPFAEVGMALDNLIKLGAKPADLSAIARWAGYEAVFSTLFELSEATDLEGGLQTLYEDLLNADPTGRAGRPEI